MPKVVWTIRRSHIVPVELTKIQELIAVDLSGVLLDGGSAGLLFNHGFISSAGCIRLLHHYFHERSYCLLAEESAAIQFLVHRRTKLAANEPNCANSLA
jgi:hypothetical protein